ncbi:hypothetical protein HDU76_001150, partial [Blyttiomyces sp. JEL0837]
MLPDRGLTVNYFPPDLTGLDQLVHLDLGGNHLEPWRPPPVNLSNTVMPISFDDDFYSNFPSLRTLYGFTPNVIEIRTNAAKHAQESNILSLNVGNTLLDGEFPEWIKMGQFKFSADIPCELYIFDTLMTGALPDSLYRFSTLGLWNNFFTGQIPSSYSSVNFLALQNNLLNGRVPDSFQKANFSYINLDNNCLMPPTDSSDG